MAYSDVKLLVLTAIPERHKSQPTGFSGRREATMAPTVTSITMVALPSHQSKMWVPGWERIRARRRRLSAVSATESAHSDQASQEAARRVIPPIPRPCSFVPWSRHHSTAAPPPKRYGNRYKNRFLRQSGSISQGSPTKEVSDVCLHP